MKDLINPVNTENVIIFVLIFEYVALKLLFVAVLFYKRKTHLVGGK